MTHITLTVDSVIYADDVEPRLLLVHYLREVAGKTGTPIGCDTSNCGACTVLMDGVSVKSCAVLAVQADGSDITTIQGMANGEWHPLQQAFHDEHALQCGYCTPGMIMAAADLLRESPQPSEDEIREAWRATSAAVPATRTSSALYSGQRMRVRQRTAQTGGQA